jgi:RNA 2',3'-cyclic 3'-phosphodiesterase
MPRLFTGLELPQTIVGQIALARGGVVGARWLEPADYHVTLRFVGDVDARTAHDVAETLDGISRPPTPVAFDGLGWFGGDKPRALVARVRADSALVELQAEQERRLRRIGLPPETRKFMPHVTLARLRGVGARAVADYLASRGALAIDAFTAERFVLFSAREGSGGGPYVVEAAYPLG